MSLASSIQWIDNDLSRYKIMASYVLISDQSLSWDYDLPSVPWLRRTPSRMAPPMISKVSIARMTTTQKVRPAGARLWGRLENRYIGNIVIEKHPLLRVGFDGRASKDVCVHICMH